MMAPSISSPPPIAALLFSGTRCAQPREASSQEVEHANPDHHPASLGRLLPWQSLRPTGRSTAMIRAGISIRRLKQIDTRNVVEIAGRLDLRHASGGAAARALASAVETPTRPAPPRNRASQATPLVVGGMLYLSSPYNRSSRSSRRRARKSGSTNPSTRRPVAGSPTGPGDETLPPQIVVGTMNGWLFTLNAKTGKLTTSFGDNGKVNLKTGVADNFPRGRYRDVIAGGNLQEPDLHRRRNCRKSPPTDPAEMSARGTSIPAKLVWTFHTVPRPGENNHDAWQDDQWVDRSGANVWGFMTVDVERGLLFVPLGTPTPDFYGGDPQGLEPVRFVAGGAWMPLPAN